MIIPIIQEACLNHNVNIIKCDIDEDAYGIYDAEINQIQIDNNVPMEMEDQIIAHEFIHAIDPACEAYHSSDDEHVRRCELRAELGAKLLCGEAYIDDGYIDCLNNNPLELLDIIDEADALLRRNGINL